MARTSGVPGSPSGGRVCPPAAPRSPLSVRPPWVRWQSLGALNAALVLVACGGGSTDSEGGAAGPSIGILPPGCEEPLDVTTPTHFFEAVRCLGAAFGFVASTFGVAGGLLATSGASLGVQGTVGAVGFGSAVALRMGISSAEGDPDGLGEAVLKQTFSGIGGLFNPFGPGVASEVVNQATGFATDAAAGGICD